MPEWVNPPPPEHIGDIYAVYGYCAIPTAQYGVAYKDHHHPFDGHSNKWVWWLLMDDGDCYPWSDIEAQDFWADRVELVRRNPLPSQEEAANAV